MHKKTKKFLAHFIAVLFLVSAISIPQLYAAEDQPITSVGQAVSSVIPANVEPELQNLEIAAVQPDIPVEFLPAGSPPLSPATPEQPFMTRVSNGVYEMSLDAYFRELLTDLLPTNLTTGFRPDELVNIELAAVRQRIQEGLAGQYDFVVMLPTADARSAFQNFNAVAPDGVEGFGTPEKDNIAGIGFPQNDPVAERLNQTFGTLFQEFFSPFMTQVTEQGKLQGSAWIDLAAINADIPTFDYKKFVLLQEMAHRWGMFLSSGGNTASNPLGILGRENSHWSFFFDAGTSPMDGLDWRDNGNGTFTLTKFFGINWSDLISGNTTPPQSNQFNDFDLYAMGLLPASQVASSFRINNPTYSGTSLNDENFFSLLNNVNFLLNPTIRGTRRSISINDIINIEGARSPLSTASQKNFSVAFVTLKTGNESSSAMTSHRSDVNALVSSISSAWNLATRGLSSMTLGPATGAFSEYRNTVMSVFDNDAASLPNRLLLNQETLRGQNHINDISQLETLLAQIDAHAAAFPNLVSPSLRDQIEAVRHSLADYRSNFALRLNEAGGISNFISNKRQMILDGVNASESSGILPTGFGWDAAMQISNIDDEYARLAQNLDGASDPFEANQISLQSEINNLLQEITDSVPPAGSFVINNSASEASSGHLTLNLNFTDDKSGVTIFRYSMNGGQGWTSWHAYTSSLPVEYWAPNGTNLSVMLQVMDGAGNFLTVIDSIVYNYPDQNSPVGTMNINEGAPIADSSRLTLHLNFSDAETPLNLMRYSTNGGATWSDWRNYAAEWQIEHPVPNGTDIHILVQVTDFAWNYTTVESHILFLSPDIFPPVGTFNINHGDDISTDQRVSLFLDFSDADSQVKWMRYSSDGGASWSEWQDYAPRWDIDTHAADGETLTILVQIMDINWNFTTVSDFIKFLYS